MLTISNDVKLDLDDVLLQPKFSSIDSRSLVSLTRRFNYPNSELHWQTGVPIIAANMDGVGTIEVAKVLAKHKVFTALHKNYMPATLIEYFREDEFESFDQPSDYSFYSMGVSKDDYDKLVWVKEQAAIPHICIDVANGYMDKFYDFIKRIRDENPKAVIMVGNVVTPEAVLKANEFGADIVKLGIGPGAMCTTRLMTGVGYPQLSCILDTVQAADEAGVLICSDGGCSQPGHVAVALAAGADFVMLGSMLSGTDEGGGEVIDGKVKFYGMSSKTANEKHFGGLKDYRSSEGRTTMVPYKGNMDDVIRNILGGLNSACTYTGSISINELQINAVANRVSKTHNRSYEQYTIGN